MLSMLVLGAMVVGGLFGVVVTLGRGIFVQAPPPHHGQLTLQITPASIALGAMITLHGSNFSPGGHVGLTRDGNIPILDTDRQNMLVVNAAGTFTDTVIVDPSWRAGAHLVQAEDVMLHKTAAFTVQVTGSSASLRPAHLLLTTGSLNLGSGDQTTNNSQTVKLSNAGGGQISWKATATQPWLLYSPQRGTINEGQSVPIRIAGARSNLKVDSYNAQVLFSSDAGQAALSVKMQVAPLEPGHEAVLQLTPAVLSFDASDGGANPPAQVVTVSNPGVRPLQWSASVPTGSSWLSLSSPGDTTLRGQSEQVVISVNTASLLPGSYSGVVTFTGQSTESVQDSPQNIYINLTVFPQCTLQVSPGALSFSSVSSQLAPAPEAINLPVSQGCTTPLWWNASSTASWLHISAASGTTPSTPRVNVTTTGLKPGTYSGTVLFNSQTGTQSLPVTYLVGQLASPIMNITPAAMTFSGLIGQPAPAAQALTMTNSGGGTLTWNAVAATAVGGNWLSVTPATGTLAAQQSAAANVVVSLPTSLIPGTYSGTITVIGTASGGQPVTGNQQVLSVTFVVKAACAISASPAALTFAGVAGHAPPAAQAITLSASGACAHKLHWTATIAAGNWLTATPGAGTVSLTSSSTTSAAVSLKGLPAGTYNATLSIRATDNVSGVSIGPPAVIAVTLTIQPACTLQTPSGAVSTFTVENGTNPTAQTFTVNLTGGCDNNLSLTPTVTLGSGTNWLAVTPAVGAMTGNSQTFTVTITSAALASGSYSGSISLSAVDDGIAVLGSPQTINVALNVVDPPALSASPGPQTVSITTKTDSGTVAQSITLSNSGGAPLNWTATLANNAPTFLSLSATSGTNLAGGTNVTLNVLAATAGVHSGTYQTSIIIQATDPLTGGAVQDSPMQIPITITISS